MRATRARWFGPVHRISSTRPDDDPGRSPGVDVAVDVLELRHLAQAFGAVPWIAGCTRCRREFLDACEAVGFTPEIVYTSDDIIVQQALVAAGLGVTTNPGLALRTHRRDDIEATPLAHFRRRVHLVTYGEPPDPPATEAFVAAVRTASQRYA